MSEPASTPSASSTGCAEPGTSAEGASASASDDPLSRSEPPDPLEPPGAPHPPDPSGDPAAGLAVRLLRETADLDPPLAGWLEPTLHQLARQAGVTRGELTVLAVDDDAMSRMHEQYAGVPGTTDVLSFDLTDAPAAPGADRAAPDVVEGDIVICLDEARRQAHRRGHDARLEALLYALHGLLHLLGEDDHDEQAYQRMHAREDALLQAVGLDAVFAGKGSGKR
ncbi:MAG: rRNA maturation RNase YbeY [Phycisphaeraceae bacterium]